MVVSNDVVRWVCWFRFGPRAPERGHVQRTAFKAPCARLQVRAIELTRAAALARGVSLQAPPASAS
jgi:hypothetical protein